jgi:hypothetical protein
LIKAVISLAAEVELEALYLNAKEAVYLQQILTEMGHPQPRTPIQTDNLTAEEIVNHKIQPKQTKAINCASIGYTTVKLKVNFKYICDRGKPILPTILPNTMHHCTMSMSGKNSCLKSTI